LLADKGEQKVKAREREDLQNDSGRDSGREHDERLRPASALPADFDSLPVPLAVVDAQLRILLINLPLRQLLSRLCGFAPDAGMPIASIPLLLEEPAEQAGKDTGIEQLCQAAFRNEIFYVPACCAGPYGRQNLLLNFTPVLDAFRHPLMLSISMQDFPGEKAVAAGARIPDHEAPARKDRPEVPGGLLYPHVPLDELNATFELAAVGIAHVSPQGQWLRVNQCMCEMLGYTRPELLSMSFRDVTHPADLEADERLVREMLDGKRSHYVIEKRYIHKSGNPIWAYLAVSLLRDTAGLPRYFISVVSGIQAQKSARAEAEESRARIKAVFNSLTEAVFVFNARSDVVEANPAALRMFGYADIDAARASVPEINQVFEVQTLDAHPVPMKKWPVARILKGERLSNIELEVRRRDSGERWVASFSGSRAVDENGRPQLAVLTVRNVTKRHLAETALRVSEQRFRTALDSIPDMVAIYDRDFRVQYVNHAMVRAAQRPASELVGQLDADIAAPSLVSLWRPMLNNALRSARVQSSDLEYPGTRGIHYVAATAVPLLNAAGQVEEVMCLFHDYTERKEAEDNARKAALHDPLTNLPNRALLFEYARHVLGGARRMHEIVAVMFIDLDRFKPINDLHGHEAGDEVLRQVAARFESHIREEDMVFRLGGDEFLVLMPRVKHKGVAGEMALHLLETINRPYHVGNLELALSASIGISLYPGDGTEIDTLINHADAAMYHAKQHGRSGYHFYVPQMSELAEGQSVIEHQLKRAISQNEFRLCYQPVVDIHSGELVCVEALLRWPGNHAGPNRFVPIAEATGLIGPVGEWVLGEACRQYRRWQADGLPMVPIAINVSSVQFKRRGLADYVEATLRLHGLDPSALQIELTETAVMDDIDHAIRVLTQLKEVGITIALDDFGTGYSSLNYLSRLPLDKLKIDQSFVERIESDTAGRAITEAIIVLGRTLGLEVVAEGIESESVLDYLRRHGCQQAQGYLVCIPLSGDDMAAWIRQRPAPATIAATGKA
jgi:diguanylate cyclase (GGDEF)-like protein/PAS domain S-box-containing protein